MRLLRYLAVAVLLALAARVVAAAPITIGDSASIPSAVLGEERPLMISLPASYEQSQASYPVLYLLDPQTRFHHTTGTVAALARTGHVPEMIVVGVVNTDRTRDLTPPWTGDEPPEDRAQVIAAGGGADNFLRFLRDELIPEVDKTYRTVPYRILVGHSFGGLFAVHALVSEPGLFAATLAISPSLWWDAGRSVEQARELFEARPELAGRLYMTLAGEGGDMLTQFQNMESVLRYRAPRGLQWHAEVLDGEDHGSIPLPSVHGGLRFFYPRWPVPAFVRQLGLAAVDRHYAELSSDYGYPITTPERTINALGYQALANQELDRAIEILRTNVDRHPGSANVYDSLGEAFEAAGKLEEARQRFLKATELGEELEDPNLPVYRQHLEAVTQKLLEKN